MLHHFSDLYYSDEKSVAVGPDGKLYGTIAYYDYRNAFYSMNQDGSGYQLVTNGFINLPNFIQPGLIFHAGVIAGVSGGRGTGVQEGAVFTYNPSHAQFNMLSLPLELGPAVGGLAYATVDEATEVKIVSPLNGVYNQPTSLSITTNAVAGAALYTVQLSTSPLFTDVLEFTATGNTIPVTGLSLETRYYARAKTNLRTEFGRLNTFVTKPVNPPVAAILVPVNNATGVAIVSVAFVAKEIPGATYTLQLSKQPTFAVITHEKTSTSPNIYVDGLAYGTTYYARVKTDFGPAFSEAIQFETRQPSAYVSWPASGATNVSVNPNITVANVVGATSYTIQLSESPDFGTVAFEKTSVNPTIKFEGLKYNTLYFNRASANGAGFSVIRSFTTSKAPGDNSVVSLLGITQRRAGLSGTVFTTPTGAGPVDVLHEFDRTLNTSAPIGGRPTGIPIQVGTRIFGMTTVGGATGYGTIYSLNVDGGGHRVLHNFTLDDGGYPKGSLLLAQDGWLYGLTNNGGATNGGTMFRIKADGTGFATLYTFQPNTGMNPEGGLLQLNDGSLVGVVSAGVGSSLPFSGRAGIFKININGSGYTLLYSFDQHVKPTNAALVKTAQGIFGLTKSSATSSGTGFLFRLDLTGNNFTVMHTFRNLPLNRFDGAFPLGGLTAAPDGTLYGTTSDSGWSSGGTIFSLSPAGSYRRLHIFLDYSGGYSPVGYSSTQTLVLKDYVLYGSVSRSGAAASSDGYVFSFNLLNSQFTKLSTIDVARVGIPVESSGLTAITMTPFAPVRIISPADSSFTRTYNLVVKTQTIPGATSYTVQLDDDPSFASPVEKTSSTATIPIPGIYGRLYARAKTNLHADFGRVTTILVGADDFVTVTKPADRSVGVNNVSLALEAKPIAGATQYHFQVSESPDFFTPIIQVSGGRVQTVNTLLKYNTTYYVRVRINSSPLYSEVTRFTTRSHEPLTKIIWPLNGATAVNPADATINASTVPGATFQYIVISEYENFTGARTSIGTSVKYKDLKYGTKYYARATSSFAQFSNETPVISFTTRDANAVLTWPAANAVNVPLSTTVSANNVAGAKAYTIQLSESVDFSSIAAQVSGPSSSMTVSGLRVGTTYYARVAIDYTNQYGPVRSFTTQGMPAPPAEATSEEQTLSIESGEMKVTIIGNPFTSRLNYRIDSTADTEAKVMLTDMRGVVHFEKLEKTNVQNVIETNAAAGVYLLRVETSKGSQVIRVMKID